MAEKRRLSERQAWACEHAKTTRCRCRCGGALHGAARMQDKDDLHMLPDGDPHYPATAVEEDEKRRPSRSSPDTIGELAQKVNARADQLGLPGVSDE